jgi:hypothetical protein
MRNYRQPPVFYTTIRKAKLFHFYHSAERRIGYSMPFIIEPIDHPISVSYSGDATELEKSIESTSRILTSRFCKHVILSSNGHKKIFDFYFGHLDIPNSVIYPACIPNEKKLLVRNDSIIRAISIVSDFELKGLDIIIKSWICTETTNLEWTIICPNLPDNYL